MMFSNGVVGGDDLHAHSFGLLSEVVQYPLAVALLEVVLPPVGVLLAFGEHGVDQSGQLVGRGRDGLGFVHARAHSPVVRPQRRLARTQGRCRQTQRLGRAVGAALGLSTHDLAAGALKAKFDALSVRKGHKKSVVALAHKMLRTIYAMLASGSHYQDKEVDYEALNVQRNAPRWIKMLRKHGFIATPAVA